MLSFKGIANRYVNFGLYKYEKEKNKSYTNQSILGFEFLNLVNS